MDKELNRISKFLSLVLRHKPEQIGLQLNDYGWAEVDQLLIKLNEVGTKIDFQILKTIVDGNEKQRFRFNSDNTLIRASQGHSIEVDLQFISATPPDFLYHGTAEKNITAIMTEGLKSQQRHHVHLSTDIHTAKRVGARHGFPVVLKIDSATMFKAGISFYISDNGVWLTTEVLPVYISLVP